MKNINEIKSAHKNITEYQLLALVSIYTIGLLVDNRVGEKKIDKVIMKALKDPLKAFNQVSHRINRSELLTLMEFLQYMYIHFPKYSKNIHSPLTTYQQSPTFDWIPLPPNMKLDFKEG